MDLTSVNSKPILLTFAANPDDPWARLFVLSAQRAGLVPQVVRCANTWDKPRALAEAVEHLPAEAIVAATDSYDVLCLASGQKIVGGFKAFSKSILFGAERGCFHHTESSRVHFEASSSAYPYRYLNGGVLVGYAGAIRDMLASIQLWDSKALKDEFAKNQSKVGVFNDQTQFGRYASMNPDIVALDHHAAICWNPSGEYDQLESELKRPGNSITNPVTGSHPAFLHVTQVRKYYPLFLAAALKIGLPVTARTADVVLFDQHLTKTVTNIDAHVVEMSPQVQGALRPTLAFRRLKASQEIVRRWKALRIDLGRTRRTLFRIGQR